MPRRNGVSPGCSTSAAVTVRAARVFFCPWFLSEESSQGGGGCQDDEEHPRASQRGIDRARIGFRFEEAFVTELGGFISEIWGTFYFAVISVP